MGTSTVSELPDSSVVAVVEYLQEQMPGAVVAAWPEPLGASHGYRVDGADGQPRHRLLVSREFLEDHSLAEIKQLLTEWQLADRLTAVGLARLVVTNDGVRAEA